MPDGALERADTAPKIGGMLFERTALSKKPEILVRRELAKLRREDTLSPDLVFRDPYFLDFLGLNDAYSEKDLETAILREMERFILELGAGYSFVARQKRIVIDGEDFYLDLLFYHRKLRRLIAVDLKLLSRSWPPSAESTSFITHLIPTDASRTYLIPRRGPPGSDRRRCWSSRAFSSIAPHLLGSAQWDTRSRCSRHHADIQKEARPSTLPPTAFP